MWAARARGGFRLAVRVPMSGIEAFIPPMRSGTAAHGRQDDRSVRVSERARLIPLFTMQEAMRGVES